jgi:hypothetical protein
MTVPVTCSFSGRQGKMDQPTDSLFTQHCSRIFLLIRVIKIYHLICTLYISLYYY